MIKEIESRRSIRRYKDIPVKEELIEEISENSDLNIELSFYAVYHPGYQNLKKLIQGGCEKIVKHSMKVE